MLFLEEATIAGSNHLFIGIVFVVWLVAISFYVLKNKEQNERDNHFR